eukprot:848387-Pleurochrysis_carterae.AAC.1
MKHAGRKRKENTQKKSKAIIVHTVQKRLSASLQPRQLSSRAFWTVDFCHCVVEAQVKAGALVK